MDEMPGELSPSPETARAEEAVDAAGRVVMGFMQRIRAQVMRNVALAREEAEDMVAEARSMSQSRQQ